MCGIVAYTGGRQALPILLDGLSRLEYRGYDSAGVGVEHEGAVQIIKRSGRLRNLREAAPPELPGTRGVSHTRWATHGSPTDENAHPHSDRSGRLTLTHNGVIENFQDLAATLRGEGHEFYSETDTEVLARWIGREYERTEGEPGEERLFRALQSAMKAVRGTYGLAVLHLDAPGTVFGLRLGSPLVLGVGKGEHFLASDVSAMVAHTRDVVYLEDRDLVITRPEGFEIRHLDGRTRSVEITRTEVTSEDTERGEYPHHMLKEIHEQPQAVENALRGRIDLEEGTAVLGGLQLTPRDLRGASRIILSACGSAWHAAMAGRDIIERVARVPVDVEIASEFRHRNALCPPDALFFSISQSGETLDTLGALREARRKGLRSLGIVNTVGSTIARESDGGVYLRAGPEIGVAATKSFTSQLTVLTLLGILLGRMHHLSSADGVDMLRELQKAPDLIRRILEQDAAIQKIAQKYADAPGMLFFGRLEQAAIAREGALKMKEISYIPSEGHASGELKHGVIALVTPRTPSVFLAPGDALFDKNVSNIQEIKARKGPVIAITTEDRAELATLADDMITVPAASPWLLPLLTVIPLQLLSYHVAVARGCDVDKPRNLAKSVTVE